MIILYFNRIKIVDVRALAAPPRLQQPIVSWPNGHATVRVTLWRSTAPTGLGIVVYYIDVANMNYIILYTTIGAHGIHGINR